MTLYFFLNQRTIICRPWTWFNKPGLLSTSFFAIMIKSILYLFYIGTGFLNCVPPSLPLPAVEHFLKNCIKVSFRKQLAYITTAYSGQLVGFFLQWPATHPSPTYAISSLFWNIFVRKLWSIKSKIRSIISNIYIWSVDKMVFFFSSCNNLRASLWLEWVCHFSKFPARRQL